MKRNFKLLLPCFLFFLLCYCYRMQSALITKTGFVKTVLQEGIGRPVKQLKRLTLKFCDTSRESVYVRQFVEERLIDFATKHPTVVVYALPETGADPQVCAEYLNGREELKELKKLDCDDIQHHLDWYALRSGVEVVEMIKDTSTDYPSIQGQWHPFTHKKDYNIKEPLDYSVKLFNAWDPVGHPWKRYYRKNELDRINKRPKLTYEEKTEKPLGKWGPDLPPAY